MKKSQLPIIILFLTVFIFPAILGLCTPRSISLPPSSAIPDTASQNLTISCLDTKTNQISQINPEEYLVGVLAAEMPASYEAEALKAQAVAARSYIFSKVGKKNTEHPDAAICTNPSHCKGWLSESDAKAKWKASEQHTNWQKLCSAVASTKGEYMTYENEIVEACFFASGGSRTENSEDVWQASLPYLRSVENPEPVADTTSEVSFTHKQFMEKLTPHLTSHPNETSPSFSEISRTNGGSVASVSFCGQSFKGTEIRNIFGLKSANFTISSDSETVTFHVTGHGHGVGMSQKGANQMAKNGKKYTEILSHYYTNIQIVKM